MNGRLIRKLFADVFWATVRRRIHLLLNLHRRLDIFGDSEELELIGCKTCGYVFWVSNFEEIQ